MDNVKCDEDVKKCMDQDTEVPPFTLLHGYGAVLKLGENWVTITTHHFRKKMSNSQTYLQRWCYILKWINIDILTVHTINWIVVRSKIIL